MDPGLSEDFHSQMDHRTKARQLRLLWERDTDSKHRYLGFLRDFLWAVRSSEPGLSLGLRCTTEVDCALLWIYLQLSDDTSLLQLVANSNACVLNLCEPVLRQHSRFFALGLLYQSNGKHMDAIQTWVNIVDGVHKDPTFSEVFEHIVSTLSQLQDKDVVQTFAPWTLQTNQETGVQIFTKRPAENQFVPKDVLTLLETYPQAQIMYLEYLIYELNNKEAGHHNHLAQDRKSVV